MCLSKACKKEVLNWTDGTWYCCGLFVRVSFLYLLACLVCIHLHVYLSVSIYPKLSSEKVLKRRSIWVKVKKVILVGNMSRDKFEMDRTHTVNTHTHTKHTHILSLTHTHKTHTSFTRCWHTKRFKEMSYFWQGIIKTLAHLSYKNKLFLWKELSYLKLSYLGHNLYNF